MARIVWEGPVEDIHVRVVYREDTQNPGREFPVEQLRNDALGNESWQNVSGQKNPGVVMAAYRKAMKSLGA